jgi:hypothetical protein
MCQVPRLSHWGHLVSQKCRIRVPQKFWSSWMQALQKGAPCFDKCQKAGNWTVNEHTARKLFLLGE